jgi:hypothetical protein
VINTVSGSSVAEGNEKFRKQSVRRYICMACLDIGMIYIKIIVNQSTPNLPNDE